MADESNASDGKLPPKLDLRKSGVLGGHVWKQSAAAGDAQVEPADESAAAAPAEPDAPTGESEMVPKSKTSRIPLESAKPFPAADVTAPGGKSKTIRIEPAAATPTVKIIKPAIPVVAPAASPVAKPTDDKRKTSRIPLESVLGADAAGQAKGAAPKTIRLKRPSEGATGLGLAASRPVVPPSAGDAAPAELPAPQVVLPAEPAAPEPRAEADVETLPEPVPQELPEPESGAAEEGGTPTRRKTIRVKRPGEQAAAVPSLSVARPLGAVDERPAAARGGEPGWGLAVIAVAALLVVCVVIYLFAAQAFGPNASLSKLSYGAPGLDLAWPGKLSASQ